MQSKRIPVHSSWKLLPLVVLASLVLATPGMSIGPDNKDFWRQWRGPNNNGVAESDAPLNFSDTENIKWRISIPGKGHSTPVISEDALYLTTAIPANPSNTRSKHDFVVMSIDRMTGKELWRKTAISPGTP